MTVQEEQVFVFEENVFYSRKDLLAHCNEDDLSQFAERCDLVQLALPFGDKIEIWMKIEDAPEERPAATASTLALPTTPRLETGSGPVTPAAPPAPRALGMRTPLRTPSRTPRRSPMPGPRTPVRSPENAELRSLKAERAHLQAELNSVRDKIRKLKLAESYYQSSSETKLQTSIDLWKDVSIRALAALHEKTAEQRLEITPVMILTKLGIDPELLDLEREEGDEGREGSSQPASSQAE